MIDVASARRQTPGCGSGMIHFNNAGASLPPACVINTVVAHLQREAQVGGYRALAEMGEAIEGAYTSAGRLLNAAPGEIALMESATRAWDAAFTAFAFAPGDRIITARAEYASNMLTLLHAARRQGVVIDLAPDDAGGQVDVAALAGLIGPRTRLIALTHAPTDSGLVNPVAAVGRLAQDAGIPFLLDACQSVGQMPVDVAAIGCTMLTATGRKFLRAPRGTGFLYVRQDWQDRLDPPTLDLRAATWTGPDSYRVRPDARRFETWEASAALRLGLGAAVDHALGWGMEAIRARIDDLAGLLRRRLAERGATVADRGELLSGIVTFTTAEAPTAMAARLQEDGINVSVSVPGWSRFDGAPACVRASVHYYNTEEEIDRFVAAVFSKKNVSG
jgi:cysteine desulfurase/selenocysteine lyase